MGLCLSICDIGVIMRGLGVKGWGLGDEDFTLHTFSWHAKIFEPFRFFVRNVEHYCTNTAKVGEAGW